MTANRENILKSLKKNKKRLFPFSATFLRVPGVSPSLTLGLVLGGGEPLRSGNQSLWVSREGEGNVRGARGELFETETKKPPVWGGQTSRSWREMTSG